ncbi:Periplasmic binding protein-like domain protein [compost metagenome]
MDAARHQFSLSIPQDLCVVGFDDIPQAAWTSYDLTTFSQPIEEIAAAAVAWLMSEDVGQSQSLRLNAPFVWRRSVRSA